MASPTETELRQTIDLKILSPSEELRDGLIFREVAISTTIGELKARIRDQVASHPSADRQRLIYRGRSLQREADTLQDVLGRQSVS
jgi:Ubiquitin family